MTVQRIGVNLVLRDGVAYARWRWRGRLIWQKAPLQGKAAVRVSGGSPVATQRLCAWLQTWQNDVRQDRWDRAHATREQVAHPTVSRLIEVYTEIAAGQFARQGSPKPQTSTDYVGKLRVIARECGVAPSASVAELTPAKIRNWVTQRVQGGDGDEAMCRARYSAWRTIAQAKAIWAGWTLSEYREKGIRLPECLHKWPTPARSAVRPPAKATPSRELLLATVEAFEALESENPLLWLAATPLFFCGLRPIDALRLVWDDVTAEGDCHVLRFVPGKTALSASDDRVQEHVLPSGLYDRMRAVNPACGYIVPGASESQRRSLYRIELNRWMRGVGWDRERFRKGIYNLRAVYNSVVRHYYGAEYAARMIGDSVRTAARFYSFEVDPARPVIDPAAMIRKLLV